ncbi:MAG: methyltransferase domain-containing protein [Porticoccaceae bacterium]
MARRQPGDGKGAESDTAAHAASGDRNFDDLAHRFKRNVYDRLKGDIRLAVLSRDLAEHVPELGLQAEGNAAPLNILDAGGGQGQFSLGLAAQGHRVEICDISANMLALAEEQVRERALASRVTLIHNEIRRHCATRAATFDLVLCHAVLEWVAEPQTLLASLIAALKPGGYLSLTFYNVNGIIMKNLLRANFAKVLKEDYQGFRGSLTPTWPRNTDEVLDWVAAPGLSLCCHSGIRCFHDYLLDPDTRTLSPEQQLALELKLSRQEPFRSLGRYIHLLYRKATL